METQLASLSAFLDCAQRNYVKVLLLKMPTTEANAKLFKGEMNRRFRECLDAEVQKFKPELWSIDQRRYWSNGYFLDSAHLNLFGAERFAEILADHLVNSESL